MLTKDYDGFSLDQAGFRKLDYATLKSEPKETRSGGYAKSKKEENGGVVAAAAWY